MNILLLSVGTRNKIVQYFRKEFSKDGFVIATDCSFLAPALYEADRYYIVPPINEDGYVDVILEICRKENIDAVLSLIDPELHLLAHYKDDFLKNGATPIVSSCETVDRCFDKYQMYKFLVSNGFKTAKTYVSTKTFYDDLKDGNVDFPVFVKPIEGSASININKVYSKDEIEVLFNRYDNLIIQEFMDGAEYGVDAYIDMISKEPVAVFIKEKIKMRAGETDKAVSIKTQELFDLVCKFANVNHFSGIIDIDIFRVENQYYISEVNPRFGGGYPHAYECGVNVPKMIRMNLMGKANVTQIGQYKENIYMMKYNDIMIKDFKEEILRR